MYLSMTQSFP